MIDRSYLLSSAHQLRQLLQLQVGMRRDAEELIRTATLQLDEAALRESVTERALGAVESRLAGLVPPQGSSQDELFSASQDPGSRTARVTVAEAVRTFLGDREEATAGEIVIHVQERRPDTPPGNVHAELSRLKRKGVVIRKALGVYALARKQGGEGV
ncbi:hypothetical protein ACIPQA_00680 [Streptomyces sp. NPDC090109]|uniref:hypothetical protein n=1 Tax=Streptomyces sp. NPDC090109 TaxID=3365948 RepID=UPI0037FFFBAA